MFAWLTGSGESPPVLLRQRSSRWFILTTVCLAIFTDIFTYGIIVPVLPFALTARANVDPAKIQTWISILLAVYGAALLAAAPLCGWIADHAPSRRAPLLAGLFALGGSTVMLTVGNSIGILVVGRLLQGFSAAVVWVVGLALLVDTIGQNEVGQVMGYVGLSMSMAILIAPLLGGVVFAHAGYYAVFAMAFGLIGLDIILRLAMVEKKIAIKWLPEDENSQSKNTVRSTQRTPTDRPTTSRELDTIDPKALTAINGPRLDEISPVVESKTAQEIATETQRETGENTAESGTSKKREWSDKLPAVIWLLSSRRLLASLWGCLIQASLLIAFDAILPLFVRHTFGWNSTGAGLIFLPIVIPSFIGPVVGHYSDKHGPRWFAVAGFVGACPCLILLRLVRENTLGQKVLLCALLCLVGINLTVTLTPLMAEITYAVDAKARNRPPDFFGKTGVYAQAYALFNMSWAAGALIGPLLGGLVTQKYGWGTAVLILGCVSVFTALPTAIWCGGSIWKERRRARDQRASSGMTTTEA